MKAVTGSVGLHTGRMLLLAILALAALSAVLLLGGSDESQADYSGKVGDLDYDVTGSTLTITGNGAIPDYNDPIPYPPWRNDHSITTLVIGDGVTTIGTYAFFNQGGLTTMTLGKGLTTIKANAFDGCGGVKTVNVHCENLSDIDPNGISDLTGITEINFAEGVQLIPVIATNSTAIPLITIPASATGIAANAFSSNKGIEKLVFKPIHMNRDDGSEVFYSYKAFDIELAEGIETIPGGLFSSLEYLESFDFPDTLVEIQHGAFTGCGLKSVTLPDSVTTLGSYAFWLCHKLETVTFGAGIQSIGREAFEECTSLKSVTIPATVTHLGEGCFNETASLKDFTFLATSLDNEFDYMFWCTDHKQTGFVAYFGPGTTVYSNFFAMCDGVTAVTIDSTTIQEKAFGSPYCVNLKTITFGTNLTSVDESSFRGFEFGDEYGKKIDVTPENVCGKTFVKKDHYEYRLSTDSAMLGNSPEAKEPMYIMLAVVLVIALGTLAAACRRH